MLLRAPPGCSAEGKPANRHPASHGVLRGGRDRPVPANTLGGVLVYGGSGDEFADRGLMLVARRSLRTSHRASRAITVSQASQEATNFTAEAICRTWVAQDGRDGAVAIRTQAQR